MLKQCPYIEIIFPSQLLQFNLSDCLKAIEDKAGVLTVLKPLVLKKKSQLPELVPQWKSEIDSLNLPENKATFLGELIGEIRTLQRILKYPQSIQSELAEK